MNSWLQQSNSRSPELHSNCICLKQCKNTSRIILWSRVIPYLCGSFELWPDTVKILCQRLSICYCTYHSEPRYWKTRKEKAQKSGETNVFCSCLVVVISYGAFPLPDSDSDSYSDYCTDSDSMQKCSTGTDSYGDSYANHGHFASLFEKLIVACIDPLLACLVIPTTGLYNNSHSFNK